MLNSASSHRSSQQNNDCIKSLNTAALQMVSWCWKDSESYRSSGNRKYSPGFRKIADPLVWSMDRVKQRLIQPSSATTKLKNIYSKLANMLSSPVNHEAARCRARWGWLSWVQSSAGEQCSVASVQCSVWGGTRKLPRPRQGRRGGAGVSGAAAVNGHYEQLRGDLVTTLDLQMQT